MREETTLPTWHETLDLASAQEGAEILDVSRQRFSQLTAKPEFPTPVAVLGVGRVWWAPDLRAYGEARPKRAGRPAIEIEAEPES